MQEKEHYYLAQIACEARRGWVKDPSTVKVEDFIMKFNDSTKSKPSDAPASKSGMSASQAAWMGMAKAMEQKILGQGNTKSEK